MPPRDAAQEQETAVPGEEMASTKPGEEGEDMLDYQTVVMQREQLSAAVMVARDMLEDMPGLASTLTVDVQENLYLRSLIFQLRGYILHIDKEETVLEKEPLPVTWWDMLKVALNNRFGWNLQANFYYLPVKVIHRHCCPHMAVAPYKEHVTWMVQGNVSFEGKEG